MIAVREKDIPDCKSRTQTLNFLWEVPRVPARDYRAKFTRDLMAWKKQTLLPNWKLTDGLPQSPLFHASQVTHTQYWEMPPARVQKCHDSNIRFLKWKCDYEHKTGKEGSKQASRMLRNLKSSEDKFHQKMNLLKIYGGKGSFIVVF